MGINITGLGAANGIGFKSKVSGGRYLPPDLKARLVSVTSCYGKKNTDSDKDILKDKTGQGNDLIVYNGTFDNIKDGYDAPFFSFMNPALTVDTKFVTYIDEVTLKSISPDINRVVLYTNPAKYKKRIPSFIINVNCSKSCRYYYIDKNKPNVRTVFNLQQGVNAVPESYADLYSGTEDEGAVNAIGFALDEGATLEVKQLSRYTGGLLTSGINGVGTFVESVKPFKEMVGDSQSVSIVSMISILEPISINYEITINNVRAITNELYGRNVFKGTEIDKTYIIGYYANLPSSTNNIGIINNILGDDKDWTYQSGGNIVDTAKLSIQGFRGTSSMPYAMVRSVIYWNIVLKGKATIDEINQVIEYFNLDRSGVVVKPDILYDIKRQGITNDNHAEFSDKLKDFIYGFDMQMYNMNWEGTSGINTYPVVFGSNKTWYSLATKNYEYTLNQNIIHLTHINTEEALQYTYLKNNGVYSSLNRETPSFRLKVTGLDRKVYLYYRYITTSDATKVDTYSIRKDGIYNIPKQYKATDAINDSTIYVGIGIANNDGIVQHDCNLTLEILPDNEGALTLNGINNFGKVTNIPIWKDYTVASLRKWLFTDSSIQTGSIVSKSIEGRDGAFILEQTFNLNPPRTSTWTFGQVTSLIENPKLNEKSIASQTKYEYDYNGKNLSLGSGLDTSRMWLGVIRDGDPRFSYISIWSTMLFRYTMSKFLLERQLKKYKLGSLYPDNSFPFRPVVTSNGEYNRISYYRENGGTNISIGSYIEKNSIVLISIRTNGIDEVLKVTVDGKEVELYSVSDNYYRYKFVVRNSYPKIDITIQEYVKYDDIVQPYPVLFVLQDKESDKELTYGNYVKVGDIIKVKSVIYYNQDLWSIHGYRIRDDSKIYSYNELINKDIVVTKPLSFGCIKKWLLSTAEPLFVYDPAIFTNSAIKTLGYLPDISGQNRHLKLYNFSYEGMSGKDGYPVVFGKNKTWTILRAESDIVKYGISSNKLTIYKTNSNSALLYSIVYNDGTSYLSTIPSFKLKVTGIRQGRKILYRYISESNRNITSDLVIVKDGTYDMPQSYQIEPDESTPNSLVGFIVDDNNDATIILEILPDYKDSLYFNGITNTASVLNLDHGGKCLVTKINYKFNQESICIYDQRKNTLEENNKKFALLATQLTDIAYGSRLEGNTYINNVLNNYVRSSELENVEHVATLVSSVVEDSNTKAPLFGRANTDQNYAQFAMYRTILLPEVPNAADRAILNKWCGLPTGYLPKPEYYWDVTGKSNSDTATRNTIKNLGTAKPVASTSYPTDFTSWISNPEYIYVNSSSNVDIRSGDRLSGSVYEGNFLTNQIVPAMQVVVTLVNGEYDTFRYRYVDEEGAYQQIYVRDLVLNEPITIDLPKNNNNNTNTGFILEANNPNAVINVTLVAQETFDEDAYSLENKNVAYEGMSGYNGYPVVFGANKTWETYATYNFTGNINGNKLHITHIEHANNGFLFSYVKREEQILNKKEIPSFKIKISGLEGDSKLLYLYLKTENATGGSSLSVGNGVHELPKSFIPTESLLNNIWVGFTISSVQEGVSNFDCDITLEILPEYTNGLCLDGITNYIECANIPAFTDYTYIIKFKDFDDNLYNSCVQYKGPYKQGGSAFVQDYISTDHSKYQLSFGGSNKISNTISVGFCTKTNYNGSTINSGTNSDGLGIVIGKWASYRKMIFYKEMLWSKSINNTYHINMLRNLINNGGIIDLNDSIFDQTSNE